MSNDRRSRPWQGVAAALVVLLLPGLGVAGTQELTTTTTRYAYNDDGALTQVVEQVDDGEPMTTYLTWDNFLPNSADPSTGTVTAANGNLIAVGTVPGVGAASRSFTFDGQDRLTSYIDANGSVSYRFHPTWLLASSMLDSGDTRRFYYDNKQTAHMTNIEDDASGLMCTEMGSVRSIDDGGLQVLLSPRKDVAGVYDPEQGTFSPYRYDAFGNEETSAPAPVTYDLYDNPHRYAGEYKDPSWGGYYLRARWYDPTLHTFISRDPMANLNRYTYGDGNAANRIDPDGTKSRHWANKPWRWHAAAKWVERQSKAGHVWKRVFLAPVIGPLGLIAEPGAFFHQQLHSAGGFKGWVTLGVMAVEIGTDLALPELGTETFAFRLLADAFGGADISVANSISHGGSQFSWRSFAQGMEYTAGGMFYTRIVAGRGYRPFTTEVEDIIDPDNPDVYNVYRVKRPVSVLDASTSASSTKASRYTLFGAGPGFKTAGPIGDMIHVSLQHEFLIAVGEDGSSLVSEVVDTGFASVELDPEATLTFLERAVRGKAKFLGRMRAQDAVTGFKENPLGMRLMSDEDIDRSYPANTDDDYDDLANDGNAGTKYYNPVTRNCMQHAAGVIRGLRFID
jgi:RHS repeat-associated protein